MHIRRNVPMAFWLILIQGAAAAPPCAPLVEEHAGWNSASLRAHASAMQDCKIDEETYRRVVREWVQRRSEDSPPLTSLSLGRAENLPWISHHLAESALRSADWKWRVRRATPGEHNRFVGTILSQAEFLHRLDQAFNGTAYRVAAVSVEKVLIGKPRDVIAGKDSPDEVPFDAQLWLRLIPRAPAN